MGLAVTIDRISRAVHAGASREHKKRWGQFFTPPTVAEFMAQRVGVEGRRLRVLDPGAGTGILGLVTADALLRRGAEAVELIAVEAEPTAREGMREAIDAARALHGAALDVQAVSDEFLAGDWPVVDVVVCNPPYRKMSPRDPLGGDAPNAYARFLEVGAACLRPGGEMVAIVPRSFTSGRYFRRFRRRWFHGMRLLEVHVFATRDRAFGRDGVLQELVILRLRRGGSVGDVLVSTSESDADLAERAMVEVAWPVVCPDPEGAAVVRLPTSADDVDALRAVDRWPDRLASWGLEVSTGPVVPFRTDALRNEGKGGAVPLLWMQHVLPGAVRWPREGMAKPQWILGDVEQGLLAAQTVVLVRRFSAKEAAHRFVAAVLTPDDLPYPWWGIENHLNVIRASGGVPAALAHGVVALLSLPIVERYFSLANGNTQVSATELRALPLPPREVVEALGRAVEPGLVLAAWMAAFEGADDGG